MSYDINKAFWWLVCSYAEKLEMFDFDNDAIIWPDLKMIDNDALIFGSVKVSVPVHI